MTETSNSKLSDKEKADCLFNLYRSHLDRWKHTRDIWFKICLTLWTLIVIAGYSFRKDVNLYSPKDYVAFIVIFFLILILLYLVYYQSYRKKLFKSQKTDMWISFKYRSKLNEMLDVKLIDESGKTPIDYDNPNFRDTWKLPEFFITLFLYICSSVYVFFNAIT
jgi:hypothetical protein